MNVERTNLYDLLKESTMKSVQIGVLKVHRNYPLKKDIYHDGHYLTVVIPTGNYPLWLNREYHGSEVRCHPLGRVMDSVMGQYQILLCWNEHAAAAEVMREWGCSCPNPPAIELAIDQAVAVPKWTYFTRDIAVVRKTSWSNVGGESIQKSQTVESLDWGEAVFQLL